MRISDWSSDLCSSDLRPHPYGVPRSSPYLQPRPWHRARHPDRPCRASDQTRSRRIIYGTGRFFGRTEERRVGKECVSSVDLGGRSIIKKKKENIRDGKAKVTLLKKKTLQQYDK